MALQAPVLPQLTNGVITSARITADNGVQVEIPRYNNLGIGDDISILFNSFSVSDFKIQELTDLPKTILVPVVYTEANKNDVYYTSRDVNDNLATSDATNFIIQQSTVIELGTVTEYLPRFVGIEAFLRPYQIQAGHRYYIISNPMARISGSCTDNHFFVGATSSPQCQLTNITNYRFPSGTIYNAVALVSGLGKDLKSKLYVDYGEAGYRTITVLDYGIYTDLFLETESIVALNDSKLISTPPVEDAIAPTAATTDDQ